MDLYLRPVAASDAPLLSTWFNDPTINRYMSTIYRCNHHTPETVTRDIQRIDPQYERLFMACVKDEAGEEAVVGHGGIDDIDFDDQRGELFFLIGNQAYQGKGLGRKLATLLIEHAFRELHLHSLFATVAVENHASLATVRKCGFTEIGLRRGFNRINGRFVDELFFDMIADDYFGQEENEMEKKK